MNTVFIDGEAGTTGLGISARLAGMPGIRLISLAAADRKNADARRDAMARSALTVLCLPDEAAREAVALAGTLGADTPKLLDASSAHRTAAGWVYGFAELSPPQPAAIAGAACVANPGCYATGAIALLRPLIDAGMIGPDHDVAINAVSGYSGGGKALIAEHQAAGGPAYELYGLGLAHKHVPEIIAGARLTRRPLFVPSVGHFRQGMIVNIPLFLDRLPGHPTAHELAEAYYERYRDARRIRPHGGLIAHDLDAEALKDSDMMEIFVAANGAHHHAVLIARLDNLGKGAAGAAVQNIALMLGLPDPLATGQQAADV